MKLFMDTEPPKIFHLWAALSASSTVLGRNIWFRFGDGNIYPNLYMMFIGSPGSRKSSAIKSAKKLVVKSGYETIAPNKSSKEKFLMDFELGFTYASDEMEPELDVMAYLDGDIDGEVKEVYIAADEWLAFFGEGNVNFATCLGDLWDYEGIYRERLKNSKSVTIPHPTVSILGGATHETFKLAFPASLLGHGFLSRMLLIYGERSPLRITWPYPITDEDEEPIIQALANMRSGLYGEAKPDDSALKALDEIYRSWVDLEDTRLQHYGTRRFTQLLKLCLTMLGHKGSLVLTAEEVIAANTILTHAEQYMGKALGEFGAAKTSNVAHIIISHLEAASKPLTSKELWKLVSRDLESPNQLVQVLQNLQHAEKIQFVKDRGYLPMRVARPSLDHLINFSHLERLLEERSQVRCLTTNLIS